MTHLHLDVWTPEPTGEGWGQRAYFWYFLIGSFVFFLAYTVFATPWVALGYELTPDYNERTRLMGVQNFVSNTVFVIGPWFLVIVTNAAWFRNQMDGARFLALAICVTTIALGVLPAIFLRERVLKGGGAEDVAAAGPHLRRERDGVSRGTDADDRNRPLPAALRRDLPDVQQLHHDLAVPVLGLRLLRRRRPGRRRGGSGRGGGGRSAP